MHYRIRRAGCKIRCIQFFQCFAEPTHHLFSSIRPSNHGPADYQNGYYKNAGGVVDPLPSDAPQFVKDYYDYYKTGRGYHPRSLNSNAGWNQTSALSFMNMPILSYSSEIQSAVLVVHGEKAHSRYFGEDAFQKLKGDNKELLIIPGASHTDLYDQKDKIPFEKIEAFFHEYLK